MGTYYFSGRFVGEKAKAGQENRNCAVENVARVGYAHTTDSGDLNKMDEMNGFEYTGTFDQIAFSSQRAGSFSSSVSSIQRELSQSRFNNTLGRWRSANDNASSGYQNIIFDATSIYSNRSQTSATSASSRRHGPLSSLARAGMNAVVKVGACWRCRFLRKLVGKSSRG
jgi:hypothetical protein